MPNKSFPYKNWILIDLFVCSLISTVPTNEQLLGEEKKVCQIANRLLINSGTSSPIPYADRRSQLNQFSSTTFPSARFVIQSHGSCIPALPKLIITNDMNSLGNFQIKIAVAESWDYFFILCFKRFLYLKLFCSSSRKMMFICFQRMVSY